MHLDLDAALRELTRREHPPTATLFGRTYTFLPQIPTVTLAQFRDAPEMVDDPTGFQEGCRQFVAGSLIDEDQDDWLDATADPAVWTTELALFVLNHMAEEYTGRPSQPSIDSGAGQAPDGRTSSSEDSPTASTSAA